MANDTNMEETKFSTLVNPRPPTASINSLSENCSEVLLQLIVSPSIGPKDNTLHRN